MRIKLTDDERKFTKNHGLFNPEELERLLNQESFSDIGEAMKQAEAIGYYRAMRYGLEGEK